MNKYKTDPKYAVTYMEIPQHDAISPEKDFSFGVKQPNTEKDQSDSDKSPTKSETEAVQPGMAFTIDFSDDTKKKKVTMDNSLSQFLPNKVRRSFKSRTVKNGKHKDDGSTKVSGIITSSVWLYEQVCTIWGNLNKTYPTEVPI